MTRPDPRQLSLDDELEDDLTFGEWVESLPIYPTSTSTASTWTSSVTSTRPDLPRKRSA